MNVLHITSCGFINGMNGLYELNLCDFLSRSEVGVKAITFTGDAIRNYIVPIHQDSRFLIRLLKEQMNYRYDVVHVHSTFWSEYPYIALLLARFLKGNVPSVLTTHAFDTTKVRQPVRLMRDGLKSKNLSNFRYAFKMTSYYFVKHIIAMSNNERDYLTRELNISKGRISVIPNGVDLARFSKSYCFRQRNGIEEDFVILYVGQLIPIKGIPYLITAFKQLLNYGFNCRLIVITRSGNIEIHNFTELCIKAGIIHRLSVFRQLYENFTDLDLVSAYKCCDLFVLPSLQECSPGVILEAMAAGKPVVTTKAVPEMVQDGSNGFLVNPANSSQLAEKMSILLGDKSMRIDMGCKGFNMVREKYDWRIIGSNILQLYKKILE